MKIKDVIKQAWENKTGISVYEGADFYSGYITQIKDGFVVMVSFVYDEGKEQYTCTIKLKIAMRRITEVYVGDDNDDLPALKNYPYSDFEHFYYDKKGLYFAETNKLSVNFNKMRQ
jgi:hypothetical protein